MTRVSMLLGCALLASCATQRGYEGPPRPSVELAVIEGAPSINAGLPLAPVLRKVDERVVTLGHSKVRVLPGEHRVLADCVMSATHTTTRHELVFETYPGRRYVLVADSAPGNRTCGTVRVEER
ncbi:MAG: hypothetical protein WCH32_04690 [Pseudomonadota bacterium]